VHEDIEVEFRRLNVKEPPLNSFDISKLLRTNNPFVLTRFKIKGIFGISLSYGKIQTRINN
jgi:hypothetical protein